MTYITNNHPAMNSSNTAGLGAYPSTASVQLAYPQTEDVHPVRSKIMFRVETVENGYILNVGHEGLYGKTYICPTPQDLADQIIASMVTQKMEK